MMSRIGRAWRILPPERRLAAIAAIGLFVSLFLPWYQETVIASSTTPALRSASASLTGWGAFSFVEAAVLLVAVGVLVLLFARAEGRAFHVPWGDGGVILAAGAWTCLLIIWRMFDKEGTTGHGQYATTSGIEWGIFVALGVAPCSPMRAAGSGAPTSPSRRSPASGRRSRSAPPNNPRRRSRGASPSVARAARAPRARPASSISQTSTRSSSASPPRCRRCAARLRHKRRRRSRPPAPTIS